MSNTNRDIALFVSFCLEEYKTARNITGEEAAAIFACYGVLDYLGTHYDVLHTQSRQWILQDIDDYINRRKSTPA